MSGGIGSFFQSLAMAPALEAQARQQALDADAQRGLQDAQRRQIDFNMENARTKAAAEAAEAARGAERTSVGGILSTAALTQGVPQHQVADFSQYLQSGQLPGRFEAPVDGVGPVQPTPSFYNDGTAGRVSRSAGLLSQALAIGDKSTENMAKASGLYRDQALGDDILAGRRTAGDVGQSQAAVAGKPLIQNIGDTGGGFNQFTGAQQTLDPALVAIFGEKAAAEVAARNAQAGASRASAASSYATAAKTRADAQRDAKSGDISVVQGPDGAVQLVNKVTGLSRPAVGLDGKPVMKKGGSGGAATEGERKAATLLTRLRGSQAQLLAATGGDASAAKPGVAAEFVRSLPVIGGDTPANLMTPEARQQVEAAQLDMLDAALTLGTGAAYTREQLLGYRKSYFPQIGDDKKTVADKQVRLANVIRAAEIASGRAEADVPTFNVPAGGSGTPVPGGPPRVTGDADYNALPPGTVFIDPQGKQRRKQ